MSFSEYARHRGVSNAAVTYAVRDGRISTVQGQNGKRMIDPGIADIQWNENTAHDQKRHTPEGATAKIVPPPPREQAPGGNTAPPPPGEESQKITTSYVQNRAVREHFQARLAKLEYENRSGKLVDAQDVQNEAYKTARSVRDAMMSIPDRIAAEIAAETNQFKVHARLVDEIRKALVTLKDQLSGDGI